MTRTRIEFDVQTGSITRRCALSDRMQVLVIVPSIVMLVLILVSDSVAVSGNGLIASHNAKEGLVLCTLPSTGSVQHRTTRHIVPPIPKRRNMIPVFGVKTDTVAFYDGSGLIFVYDTHEDKEIRQFHIQEGRH